MRNCLELGISLTFIIGNESDRKVCSTANYWKTSICVHCKSSVIKFICQSHYCEFYNMVKSSGKSEKELPQWLRGEESACNAGNADDTGSIPALGRTPGGGNGNPVQYSCLENPMDRGAWWATVHRVAKSQTLFNVKVRCVLVWECHYYINHRWEQ